MIGNLSAKSLLDRDVQEAIGQLLEVTLILQLAKSHGLEVLLPVPHATDGDDADISTPALARKVCA